MNPFHYPEVQHARTQSPGSFSDYRRYKPFLRIEFKRQCVYCRLPDGAFGEDHFGADHYRPVSRFPQLQSHYQNLFYACNTCNRRKRNFWPSEQQWNEGFFIPNPCDCVMAQHLIYRGGRVEPKSPAGQLACEILSLNHPENILYREFLLRAIERCLSATKKILAMIEKIQARLDGEGSDKEKWLAKRSRLEHQLALHHMDLERLTGWRSQAP